METELAKAMAKTTFVSTVLLIGAAVAAEADRWWVVGALALVSGALLSLTVAAFVASCVTTASRPEE